MERKPLPNNAIALLFRGLTYPIAGLRFINVHKMWGLASMAIIINIVVLAALLAFTIWQVIPWLEALDAWFLGLGEGAWQSALEAFTWVYWVAAIVALIGLNGLVLVLVGQAVASPFLDMLSERTEAILTGQSEPPFSLGRAVKSVFVALGDLFWGIMYLIAINVPLLLVGLVPLIGTGIAAVVGFVMGCLLLSQEFVGLPLARKLVSYPVRWRLVWREKWVTTGFGATTMAMVMVPILNLMLLPLAAVGGTLLYCDLRRAGRVPDNIAMS